MDTQKLRELLTGLSGHLAAETDEQELEVTRLREMLVRSLLSEDVGELKASRFSHEGADLFQAANVPADRAASILAAAESAAASEERPEFRVFVREVPVRSTQVHGSIPLWAGGSAIERTLGPFTFADGRRFWFDFIRIEKLITLFVQGQAEPALLFKVTRSLLLDGILQPERNQTTYNLTAGSVWINSRLLAPDAPAGYYSGLTIDGGAVTLTAPAQVIAGKLTVAASTAVRVQLRLRQPAVTNADETSPYGEDARESELRLPESFSFRFSGAGGVIEEVSEARWSVFGHVASFVWNRQPTGRYDNIPHRVLVPLNCSERQFEVRDARSPFLQPRGAAEIEISAWALTSAPIDIANPTAAAGAGALLVKCRAGLSSSWKKLEAGEFFLQQPYVMAEPGRVSISDIKAKGGISHQSFKLWRDDQNPHGTSVEVIYPHETLFLFFSLAQGDELLAALGNADFRIDRPVTVSGEPPAVRSKNSLLTLALGKNLRLIYLFDDNILFDSFDPKKPAPLKPLAFALTNALFKVTPANGCLLFGRLNEDLEKVVRGSLYLTFGMYAYLPTLPDPYAANLGFLRYQLRGRGMDRIASSPGGEGIPWLWLVARVRWSATMANDLDAVSVTFHFAPLQNQFQALEPGDFLGGALEVEGTTAGRGASGADQPVASSLNMPNLGFASTGFAPEPSESLAFTRSAMAFGHEPPLPDYGGRWDERTQALRQESFALLDVSTRADLLGISFGPNIFGDRRLMMVRTHDAVPDDNRAAADSDEIPGLPLQVEGIDVVSRAAHVRTFTVPQISWEPVHNLTPPGPPPEDPPIVPTPPPTPGDPPLGFNYYPDDGGPTRILNNGADRVALAPLPVTNYLVRSFDDDRFLALAMFGLPFGMKALAVLKKNYTPPRRGTRVSFDRRTFEKRYRSARRLKIDAGEPQISGQGDMFMGSTVQLNNVLDVAGTPTGDSTLGGDVTTIFNQEFFDPGLIHERGVPVTRVDLSGYGSSIFSNWRNPKAPIASTSQARFDVYLGRCAHEVIQVISIVYPYGAVFVRTITLIRGASNYVHRIDSGWKAISHGLFDFTHFAYDPPNTITRPSPYEIHRSVIGGVFNIRNIKEAGSVTPFIGSMTIPEETEYVDGKGIRRKTAKGETVNLKFKLRPVFFDADVDVENAVSGFAESEVAGAKRKMVVSKKILGFVQISPLGQPLTPQALAELVARQGTIGGPVDCIVDIAGSGQLMRVNRFDVANSINGTTPIFAVAARGNVTLPKDGSWTLVRHEHSSGDVSPVPQELSVPLIRVGRVKRVLDEVTVDPLPNTQLARVAETMELLRAPTAGTVNYGFLHSTDTQKALFLNPSFLHNTATFLSKTPPLFADAFRIVNSKGIFPNIGDAVTNFGKVISLVKSGNEFGPQIVAGGQSVYKLLDISKLEGEQAYSLLKKIAEPFKLPPTEFELIKVGTFRIYIEYKAQNAKLADGTTQSLMGGLDFNIDSFSEGWKSHMSNVAIVVDLGPIPRLMTIKGNWNAKKGEEAKYGGGGAMQVPRPQIEFAPVLKPAMDILQILEQLQGGDYAGAFGRGVRLAMSNKAGTWEYKFEAAKEIPVLKFPPIPVLYNDPNCPFKLEAGLRLGAYFNAALKVPSSANQLLPTAGGFLGFYGRLSVMCVSLSVATIYAVGQVNLDIGADTKSGPSLRMKFGFGAQIVVGLPVIANVSVLYVVGVEIFITATGVEVSAFLLFQGHADVLGGLIGVTITIEAKGSVKREIGSNRTELAAQVSFALEISLFLIIDITISESWEERRQIA